jgi:glycosyltransferase involved in cell wall biosynthesis
MFWLRRTLLNADMVTYPCAGLWDFHAKLARLKHDAEIIPHIGSRSEPSSHESNGKFCLVHAGKLGTAEVTRRSAKSFLMGLKAFVEGSADAAEHTTFVLVGPKDKETESRILELGLQRNVQAVGRVGYEESLSYIASASVCILIESSVGQGIFFPSKLADYLVSSKPVLAISPRIGVAADLASRGELIRIDQDDPAAVQNAMNILYSEFKRGKLWARKPGDQVIEQLQGQNVAKKLLRACQTLISRFPTNPPPARLGGTGESLLQPKCERRRDLFPASR